MHGIPGRSCFPCQGHIKMKKILAGFPPASKNMVTVELVKDSQAMQTLTHHTHHRLKLTRLFACAICSFHT